MYFLKGKKGENYRSSRDGSASTLTVDPSLSQTRTSSRRTHDDSDAQNPYTDKVVLGVSGLPHVPAVRADDDEVSSLGSAPAATATTGSGSDEFRRFQVPAYRDDWDVILDSEVCFLKWSFFNENVDVDDLDHEEILASKPDLLVPFRRRARVVYISYRFSTDCWIAYIKSQAETLSRSFDGFFVSRACMSLSQRQNQLDDLLPLINKQCYVMVVNEFDVYASRFWMMWECLFAAKNRRLIINEFALPLLEITGANPTLATVRELLSATVTDHRDDVKEKLLANLDQLYFDGAQYSLIPVSELVKDDWESVHAVPLSLEQVNPARVFMVSHRWLTEKHPDPENKKLKVIRDFWLDTGNTYDYFFFDYRCIAQQYNLTDSLVKVDELYAQSHCLCLCDGDYFERSWCLFEISVNKFNVDSLTLRPDIAIHNGNGTTGKEDSSFLTQNAQEVLSWLQLARTVQQMGYVHVLHNRTFTSSTTTDVTGELSTTTLNIPSDQLHLKEQLRSLFVNSRITNKGDKSVLMFLLDKLI